MQHFFETRFQVKLKFTELEYQALWTGAALRSTFFTYISFNLIVI